MSTRARRIAAACILAASLPSPALAADPPATPATPATPQASGREKARELAERGQDLLLAGRAAEALPLFVEADAAFHAPTIVLLRGRAEVLVGRVDEAYASFTRILDEPFDDAAPAEFAQAREIAAIERSKLAAGQVRVEIGGLTKGTTVSVDGAARAPDLSIYLVAPGARTLRFVMPDGRTHEEVVDGAAGEIVRMAVPPPPERPQPVPLVIDASAGAELTRVPAWIGFGLAAVGVGVGAGFGVLALDTEAELEAACPTFTCDPADRALADDAGLFADVSTASFVVGGVGAAFGVVWLIVAAATDEPSPEASAPRIGVRPARGGVEVAF